ncbi:MAG TPA: DnaA/Hda family protein [Pirellulaceae bacterium]|nr:DnaA/Hda family protein [Pirellulaceae bacterium]
MTKDDREIVSAVTEALAGRVGRERFELWFGRSVRIEWALGKLRVLAAEAFRLDLLRRAFRADLLAAAMAVLGADVSLEFAVDAALAQESSQPAQQPGEPPMASRAATLDRPAGAVGARAAAPSRAQRLDGQPRTGKPHWGSLCEFIPGEANRLALTAAQTAAERPGEYSPLTLVGPAGSGKTHLLEGIWRQAREHRTCQRVIYLSAEQFTNQFLDALRQSGTPSFRRKYRDVELLLIDDVQFFAGKQSTLVELVHTIDTLVRDGRQVVCSSDRPPAELRTLGPELVTRLAGGLVCTIQPADFATRLGILRQIAGRQRMQVPEDVLQWLAGQLDGDARHLAGALNRLRAASDAHERPIDLAFAQDTLDDLIHACRRPVRLPQIVEAVCDVLGVESDQLQSSSKSPSVTLPRMLIMFLARKHTRAALSEISRTLGRKSHSTVVSAQHTVTEWLAGGKTVPAAHGSLKVEDAIKRVEGRLKLG